MTLWSHILTHCLSGTATTMWEHCSDVCLKWRMRWLVFLPSGFARRWHIGCISTCFMATSVCRCWLEVREWASQPLPPDCCRLICDAIISTISTSPTSLIWKWLSPIIFSSISMSLTWWPWGSKPSWSRCCRRWRWTGVQSLVVFRPTVLAMPRS